MKFEQLVEEEEVTKQEKQTEKKKGMIAVLKTNKECLERAEHKDENLQRSEMERKGVEDLIDNLKDSVKSMILTQRTQESQKIKLMRKLKKQYDSDEDSEMQEVRSSMAKTLSKTYKKGDKTHCIKEKEKLNMSTDTEPYCKEAYKEVP